MPSDKGPSTLVYIPSRLRMSMWLVGYIIFMAVLIFIIVLLAGHPGLMHPVLLVIVLCSGVVALLIVAGMCMAILYRMLRLFPSLIVGADGIVDNGSLIYRGVGFIPWAKITSIAVRHSYLDSYHQFFRVQFLTIGLEDYLEYSSALPRSIRLQRIFLRVALRTIIWSICIPRFLLPHNATTIYEQISDAYQQWRLHRKHSVRFK